jgi:hypothetical protein
MSNKPWWKLSDQEKGELLLHVYEGGYVEALFNGSWVHVPMSSIDCFNSPELAYRKYQNQECEV